MYRRRSGATSRICPAGEVLYSTLLRLTMSASQVPVIVPMTIADTGYFREIIGSLRAERFDVHQFALVAEPLPSRAASTAVASVI
jgi:hypothetical protein